ncbi:hypothetical protein BW13_00035 [Bifidobacterium sp. UTCIF-37]|uniref:antitoxin VbhA family protein n=1 Tax=unclassified Bifidobacterium TaxID=2608897 RepID=UPI0011294116|nr:MULTISPECIES: antitoxin VbhA family protein [unclassified Bifidobacterium]TPF87490.1 hypothetical protein BW13_00035 [Bifidobacterium sp. UTCIF-37]TPF91516.1 hypothetical protein BW11_00035 [Bifidobacterium sp. UTCIF-38]
MDRKRAVEEAIHSGEMEGAYVSDEFRNDANEFAQGGMSIEQLMQRAWRRNNHGAGMDAHAGESHAG